MGASDVDSDGRGSRALARAGLVELLVDGRRPAHLEYDAARCELRFDGGTLTIGRGVALRVHEGRVAVLPPTWTIVGEEDCSLALLVARTFVPSASTYSNASPAPLSIDSIRAAVDRVAAQPRPVPAITVSPDVHEGLRADLPTIAGDVPAGVILYVDAGLPPGTWHEGRPRGTAREAVEQLAAETVEAVCTSAPGVLDDLRGGRFWLGAFEAEGHAWCAFLAWLLAGCPAIGLPESERGAPETCADCGAEVVGHHGPCARDDAAEGEPR